MASYPFVQQRELYHGYESIPLEHRIYSAPLPIIYQTHQSNLRHGVDVRLVSASPHHPLIPILKHMIRSLPMKVYRLASAHVVAIYLVEHTFGSALVEGVRDSNGQWRAGYIVLNLSALNRTANEWLTWRENSAFHASDRFYLRATLEKPETDTIESALRFVFLHELGHILGMSFGLHGFWTAPESQWLTNNSPFIRLSWELDRNGKLYSPWKLRFPVLAKVHFYRFEAAPLSKATTNKVYSDLALTNFPSLYGSLDPYEDFAESFALYVHTQILNKPYSVEIYYGDYKNSTYYSCLQKNTCPGKTNFMRRISAWIFHKFV